MTPSLRAASIAMALLFITSGCASTRAWHYTPDSYARRPEPGSSTVAVTPFRDSRPDVNHNYGLMYLIPLMPIGPVDYSTPESGAEHVTSAAWQFRPSEDFARGAAAELQASGLFKEAYYSERGNDADLVFTGNIISTNYSGSIISYGLSAYGPLLWIVGLPAGTVHNELVMEMSLTDRRTGAVVWSGTSRGTYERSPFWLYAMPSDFDYDNLFKPMMKDAVTGIQPKLAASHG